MSRFLGASSRGGIQSSSLSDGTLTMSNGMLEGVVTINGVTPAQIASNTALLGGVASTLATHGSTLTTHGSTLATHGITLASIPSTIASSANIGTLAFDVTADDPATNKVYLGTPFFPLYINSSEILFGDDEMIVNQLSIKNKSATVANIAETKSRIHALHDTPGIGINLLDNYIDFILHQSTPLVTGGYLSISANGGTDLVRYYYAGLDTKKTDFMSGALTNVYSVDNGSNVLRLGSETSEVVIGSSPQVGTSNTYIGRKLPLRDDPWACTNHGYANTNSDCYIRWGGDANNVPQLFGNDICDMVCGGTTRLRATAVVSDQGAANNRPGKVLVAATLEENANMSDDRLKTNEQSIVNATDSLMKLHPHI